MAQNAEAFVKQRSSVTTRPHGHTCHTSQLGKDVEDVARAGDGVRKLPSVRDLRFCTDPSVRQSVSG